MQTGVCPRLRYPSFAAAALERSIILPRMNGPRSLILTMTLLPFRRLVTRTFVPNRKLRCAAVIAEGFMRSPEAVLEVNAYQEALPHCEFAWTVEETESINMAVGIQIWIDLRNFVMFVCPI